MSGFQNGVMVSWCHGVMVSWCHGVWPVFWLIALLSLSTWYGQSMWVAILSKPLSFIFCTWPNCVQHVCGGERCGGIWHVTCENVIYDMWYMTCVWWWWKIRHGGDMTCESCGVRCGGGDMTPVYIYTHIHVYMYILSMSLIYLVMAHVSQRTLRNILFTKKWNIPLIYLSVYTIYIKIP